MWSFFLPFPKHRVSVKSFESKFDTVGEILKGLKYKIDTLEKSHEVISKTPLPRQSIKDVGQLKKSFNDPSEEENNSGNQNAPSTFNKSEVEDAIDDLVKSKQVSSALGTEFELYGKINNPHHGKLIASQVIRNRKKTS